MANKPRPLSPHLSIYKPQLTSMTSITHRATGVGLFVSLNLLCWYGMSILLQNMGLAFEDCDLLEISNSIVFKLILAVTIFAFYYHLANGVRHLFWDIGMGFELKKAYLSGYAVIIFTVIMTALTFYIAL